MAWFRRNSSLGAAFPPYHFCHLLNFFFALEFHFVPTLSLYHHSETQPSTGWLRTLTPQGCRFLLNIYYIMYFNNPDGRLILTTTHVRVGLFVLNFLFKIILIYYFVASKLNCFLQ